MGDDSDDSQQQGTDFPEPREFLSALLRIKPEDAAKARARAASKRATNQDEPQEGPAYDYGEG